VKEHLRNVYRKLGAADRAQAVAIALRTRLIN
jgi:DNA-binding CsgD family transcriptional regulator